MTAPYHALGDVDELLPVAQAVFAFPEFAKVTPILATGTSTDNYVIQSSSASVRRAAVSWEMVPELDVETIRGYAESKDRVVFEDDGVERTVIVFDFTASLGGGGLFTVGVTLVETTAPVAPGS